MPGLGTKIPQTMQCNQKKKKRKEKEKPELDKTLYSKSFDSVEWGLPIFSVACITYCFPYECWAGSLFSFHFKIQQMTF